MHSFLSTVPLCSNTLRVKSQVRSISIKKKRADRIRLLRAPGRIARRSMKSRLSHGLFRSPSQGIRHKACRGAGGTRVPPKGPSRNNEQKNMARPNAFNDAPLSAVMEKSILFALSFFSLFCFSEAHPRFVFTAFSRCENGQTASYNFSSL